MIVELELDWLELWVVVFPALVADKVYPVIQPLLSLTGTPPATGATGLQLKRF